MGTVSGNVVDILAWHDQQRLCIMTGDRTWSYGELKSDVERIGYWLSHQNIKAGDVIAHDFDNDIYTFVCMLASASIGATVLTLPRNSSPLMQADIYQRGKVTHVLSETLRSVSGGIESVVFDERLLSVGVDELVGESPYCANPTHPWQVVLGSGSTGSPKLMAYTHAQQLARVRDVGDWLPLTKDGCLYSFVNLDFNATKQRYLEALALGASIYIKPKDADVYVKEMRVSLLFGTAYHFEKVLEHGLASDLRDEPDAISIITGGSIVSSELRQRIVESLTPNLFVLYGTNETHTCTITRLTELLTTKGGVGRAHQDYTIQIVNSQGEVLPDNKPGEVRIKSPGMVTGYMNDSVASERSFKDGWFFPGDLARQLPSGELVYLGRTDDLMSFNGINIYPAEIQAVLMSHPQVLDAYAFSFEHSFHQDIPVCAVRKKPNCLVSEEALLDYCKERLGSRTPHGVFFVKEFPIIERGKIEKQALRKEIFQRFRKNMSKQRTIEPSFVSEETRSLNMTFDLAPESSGQFSNLRRWLVEALCIDEERIKTSLKNDPVSYSRDYLTCLFCLSEILFQQSGVPVFSPPQIRLISKVGKKSDKYQVTIRFHEIELLPKGLYPFVYNMSFRLCSWMSQAELNAENRKKLYSMIKERVTKKLKSAIPSGKSTVPVLNAAHGANIPFRHLGLGVYQLGWGSKARRLDRSMTDGDSTIGARLSHSKLAAAQILRTAGLPAPRHELVETTEEALKAASTIAYPIVVKPNDLDRGEGVTVDICNEEQLLEAFAYARAASSKKPVLIEKQAAGVCHRIFIADGRLLYAVRRNAMSIIGDGINSVVGLVTAELLKQDRMPTWLRSELMPIDDLARKAIESAGHTLESVPTKGELVPLRRIESTQWGGVDQEVTDTIHPENLRIAVEATRLIGLNVAGVDIICEDISKPWYETGAIINEVNLAPLLGGAAISRRHVPEFLDRLIEGDGRIPIEVVTSSNAKADALAKQVEFTEQGLRCYVTSSTETYDHKQNLVPLALDTVEQRVRAVLTRADADALVVYED